MSEPAGIRRLLVELAGKWGIDHPAETVRLFVAWERIVGPEVAWRCEPVVLKSGVLKVRAESAAWAAELRYLGPEIARRVNQELGGELVKEVRITIGPRENPRGRPAASAEGPSTEPQERPPGHETTDPPAASAADDELVAPIAEKSLAEATKRALLAAKTRRKRD